MLHASRLSSTPTRSLIRYAIISQTGSPRCIDCLAPLLQYKREVSFSRTHRYIAHFRNQTENRESCDCQLALLSKVSFQRTQTSVMPCVGIEQATLRLLLGALTTELRGGIFLKRCLFFSIYFKKLQFKEQIYSKYIAFRKMLLQVQISVPVRYHITYGVATRGGGFRKTHAESLAVHVRTSKTRWVGDKRAIFSASNLKHKKKLKQQQPLFC